MKTRVYTFANTPSRIYTVSDPYGHEMKLNGLRRVKLLNL